jgi:hypothetical protein
MLVMRLNYNKDRRRVDYFERSARAAAGTTKTGEGKGAKRRKVKVPMVEGQEGGGFLELVVENDQVYLVSFSVYLGRVSTVCPVSAEELGKEASCDYLKTSGCCWIWAGDYSALVYGLLYLRSRQIKG